MYCMLIGYYTENKRDQIRPIEEALKDFDFEIREIQPVDYDWTKRLRDLGIPNILYSFALIKFDIADGQVRLYEYSQLNIDSNLTEDTLPVLKPSEFKPCFIERKLNENTILSMFSFYLRFDKNENLNSLKEIIQYTNANSAENRFKRAQELQKQGKYEEAIEIYRRIHKDEKTYFAARYHLGLIYTELALHTEDINKKGKFLETAKNWFIKAENFPDAKTRLKEALDKLILIKQIQYQCIQLTKLSDLLKKQQEELKSLKSSLVESQPQTKLMDSAFLLLTPPKKEAENLADANITNRCSA